MLFKLLTRTANSFRAALRAAHSPGVIHKDAGTLDRYHNLHRSVSGKDLQTPRLEN